jgi:hypothetical protein
MGARQSAIGLPADTQILSGPFSRREKLMFHLAVFLIGSWNLAIINVARSPHHLWFWPWVAAWAAVLIIHSGLVLWSRSASAPSPVRPPGQFPAG